MVMTKFSGGTNIMQLRGKLLKLQSGLIVVPFHYRGDNLWECVIVNKTDNYRPGDFNIVVPFYTLEDVEVIDLEEVLEKAWMYDDLE